MTFGVSVAGAAPFVYQWQHEGTNISNGVLYSGTTNAVLTITNARLVHFGNYTVSISNSYGSVTSSVAGLTLKVLTTLYNFTALNYYFSPYTNSDGANPYGSLTLSGETLYGTADIGGSGGSGTVFKISTNGTGYTTLYSFTTNSDYPSYTNSEGAYPNAVILSGNIIYGTTYKGGSSGYGTVFKVNTNGTGFTILHTFTGSDGMKPESGLILSGNTLYGTTSGGGPSTYGVVFAINTNGTGFTILHGFSYTDGGDPQAGLILSGNTLYGTTYGGGSSGYGVIFAVNTNGTGFTNLYNFSFSIGARPSAGLIMSGNTLYGTTSTGGSSGSGYGTVFAINTNGTGFTTLHNFTTLSSTTNSDGANPNTSLILSGNILYGAAQVGGASGNGAFFAINTDGSGFANLYSFTASKYDPSFVYTNSDGANPNSLILSGNTLYGTANQGGSSGNGTIFSFSLGSAGAVSAPPQLIIISSGSNVVLTWPTNAVGFTLQSTTNLASPSVWSSVSPAPVIVNGKNTVTNAVSGTRKFYRLSQ